MSTKESAVDALVALGVSLTLSTGLTSADAILGNVLQYGKVSQIAGESGVGKTQLCYAVVARFLLHTTFSVAWFDSNGSFRAHRLRQFLLGMEEIDDNAFETLLERVAVTHIADHLELVEALELVDDYFEEYCIRLLVIDNMSEMMDERLLDENMTRTAIMAVITNRIGNLANIGCTVVLISCTVQEDDEKNELYRSWIQQMHGRVILRREREDVRTICSSKMSGDSSIGHFKINRDGLQNVN
ncbi:unnamed protein product [Cylicocyclus nassatus]|uniref:RecA family profile 1 domain-containing protein n=1 Tax=Cylicocyclus nassatus TaxID=53992 RepID=A0AA36GXX6_CYLNA|nr:unnamed protein product [Cylicocyclus nassatus]